MTFFPRDIIFLKIYDSCPLEDIKIAIGNSKFLELVNV